MKIIDKIRCFFSPYIYGKVLDLKYENPKREFWARKCRATGKIEYWFFEWRPIKNEMIFKKD